MKRIRITGILYISAVVAGICQGPWSLDQCIQYAIDNNLDIKRQELSARMSKNEYLQSVFALGPDLYGFGRHNYSSGKTVNLEDYTYINTKFYDGYAGARTSITLFNGLQAVNTIGQNKYSLKSAVENVEKVKNNISINIAVAYLQILLDRELLKIAEGQLEVTRLQVEKSRRMVEVGSIARGELLEIQAQESREKLNVTIGGNNLDMSYLRLSHLLDLDSAEGFEIVFPEDLLLAEEMIPASLAQVLSYAEGHFPEVKSAAYNLESSRKALKVARGSRSPSLGLEGTLYSRYSELAVDPLDPASVYAISNQLDDNLYKQVSLSLYIPIYDRFTIRTRISNARLQLEDARFNLEQVRKTLTQEIQQAYADAIASYSKYLSAGEAVESMDEAFRYTGQKFDLGSSSSVDYNMAKNNLAAAQSELQQARFEYILRTKILEFYLGNKITL